MLRWSTPKRENRDVRREKIFRRRFVYLQNDVTIVVRFDVVQSDNSWRRSSKIEGRNATDWTNLVSTRCRRRREPFFRFSPIVRFVLWCTLDWERTEIGMWRAFILDASAMFSLWCRPRTNRWFHSYQANRKIVANEDWWRRDDPPPRCACKHRTFVPDLKRTIDSFVSSIHFHWPWKYLPQTRQA